MNALCTQLSGFLFSSQSSPDRNIFSHCGTQYIRAHNQAHKDYIFSQWTISELMMPCGNLFLLESGQKYPSQHNQACKETVSFVAVNLFQAG